MDPRTMLQVLGLAAALAALLVTLHFAGSLVVAVRSRRYLALLASLAGIASMLGMMAAVVVVWFGYAVAHVEKTADTDLRVFLATVPPYFLLSLVLWWLAGKLRARLEPGAPPSAGRAR